MGGQIASLLSYGWEACEELITARVLSQIVREALAKKQRAATTTQGDGGSSQKAVGVRHHSLGRFSAIHPMRGRPVHGEGGGRPKLLQTDGEDHP